MNIPKTIVICIVMIELFAMILAGTASPSKAGMRLRVRYKIMEEKVP